MGKGGYSGGSTVIGPWSSGWFSSGRGKATPVKPGGAKKAKPAGQAKTVGKRTGAAAEQRAKQKAMKAMPTPRRDPAEVAARLAVRMEGVTVRRITKNTLRIRKPKD